MNSPRKPLWTWDMLCSALGQPQVSGPDIFGIHFDSRLIQKGDLFIPLKGRTDGHEFVTQAMNNGAAGTLTEIDTDRTIKQICVENTMNALSDLAFLDENNCSVLSLQSQEVVVKQRFSVFFPQFSIHHP